MAKTSKKGKQLHRQFNPATVRRIGPVVSGILQEHLGDVNRGDPYFVYLDSFGSIASTRKQKKLSP